MDSRRRAGAANLRHPTTTVGPMALAAKRTHPTKTVRPVRAEEGHSLITWSPAVNAPVPPSPAFGLRTLSPESAGSLPAVLGLTCRAKSLPSAPRLFESGV